MTGNSLATIQTTALDMPQAQKEAFKGAFAMLLRHCKYSTYGLDDENLRLRNIEYALFLREFDGQCVALAAAEWCGGNGESDKYPTAGQLRGLCQRILAAIDGKVEKMGYYVDAKDFTRRREMHLQQKFESQMLPATRAYVAARREEETERRAAEQHAQREETKRAIAEQKQREEALRAEAERLAKEKARTRRAEELAAQREEKLRTLAVERKHLAGMEAAGGGESVYARFARRRIEVLEKEVGND